MLPVQNIFADRSCFSHLFQLFSARKLDLRLCFYRRVYFKQLICNHSPFLEKMPSFSPFPYMGPQHWRLYFKWNIELQNIKTADKITSREGLAGDASRPIQLSQGWQDEMFSDVWICGILCSLLLSQMGASGSLSNIRCARSQRCRSAGSVVAVPAAAAVAPHTRQRTHTLGYLLDSFSQLSQFWFSDIRITNGGMCLMRKALLIKLAKNGLSPILTRSGFTDRC